MKLERQDIEKMIHNVLSYDFDDKGYLHFRRFTKPQLKVYEAASQGWFDRANASASVAFDFISDSDYIAMKCELYSGSNQTWADFDLYVDGIFYEHKEIEKSVQAVMGFDLPKGEHRVTIYFPWTKETVVEAVYLTDGAYVKEVEKKAKWLAIGDSITQGATVKLTSLAYVNQVARSLDLEVVNQGVGGYFFDMETIEESIALYKPDIITIAYGSNDYTRYDFEEDFRKHTSEYIEKFVNVFPKTKILGILPLYRYDQKHQILQKYRTYTFADAKKILLDTYQKYDNITVLEEAKIPRVPEVYMSDCTHLNELGYAFLANAVKEKIEGMLEY